MSDFPAERKAAFRKSHFRMSDFKPEYETPSPQGFPSSHQNKYFVWAEGTSADE
jgi:hypothetical protein